MAGRGDIQAGGAFVRLFFKDDMTRALKRSLSNAGRSMQSFGSSISSLGAKVTGVGALMGAAFVPAIKAASDMQETMSKFGVVFGDQSDAVKAWGDQLAESVGRSKQQMASFLSSAQDLFVPLGFAADAAEDMSKQVTKLAVDLGSFNNMADADVMRDLQAALTGSGEVMKKYGVLVSEAAVKQKLLDDGMDPKTATDQQKVMARLAIIMAGTTAAQGDAIRTSGSFANQLKRLKASLSDTAVEVGNALLPAVTEFANKAGTIIKRVAAWARDNGPLILTLAKVAVGVVAAGGALTALGVAMSGAGVAVAGLSTALSALGVVVGLVLSPVGLVVVGSAAALAAFVAFTDTGGKLAEVFGAQITELGGIFGKTLREMAAVAAAGEIESAMEMMWIQLKLISKGSAFALETIWLDMKNRILTSLEEVGAAFGTAVIIAGGALASVGGAAMGSAGAGAVLSGVAGSAVGSLQQNKDDAQLDRQEAHNKRLDDFADETFKLQEKYRKLRAKGNAKGNASETPSAGVGRASGGISVPTFKGMSPEELAGLATAMGGLTGLGLAGTAASLSGGDIKRARPSAVESDITTYSAAAAQAAGQGGASPAEKMAKSVDEMRKETKETGKRHEEMTLAFERWIGALTFG